MVKKVIMNLDLSKASSLHCSPVVVLKNCEPKLSYLLAELFNKCLGESSFPDFWKVSPVVPVFKNVGRRTTTKSYYHPVSLLSVVSKVFEKLVNNRIVDHLQKCGLISDFQYWFKSSQSTADLLTILSYRIALTGLPLLELWHLIYPRLLAGFDMLDYFTNFMKFQVRHLPLFLLFSVIDSLKWFWIESVHKNIQSMLEFLKAPSLVLHFSCYTLMTFLTMLSAILLSMLMILLSILRVIKDLICGNNLN